MELKSQVIFEVESTEPANFHISGATDKKLKIRLDKWLWAARFFKTRALARSAIEHGRVRYNGEKTIPSKEIAVNANIEINQGVSRKTVSLRVCKLSSRRRSTEESNELFEILSPNNAPQTLQSHAETLPKQRRMARFLRRALGTEGETTLNIWRNTPSE